MGYMRLCKSVLKRYCNCKFFILTIFLFCLGFLIQKVYVRRPTGNTSWIMRIENGGALLPTTEDFPLADISSLLLRNRELDLDIDAIEYDDEEDDDAEDAMIDDREREGREGLDMGKDAEPDNQSVAKQQGKI